MCLFDIMFCILLGIVPFNKEYWGTLKQISTIRDVTVDWRSHAEIKDDGINTFVVSIVSEISDPTLLEEYVREFLKSKYGEQVETEIWASVPAPIDLKPKEGYKLSFQEAPDSHLREWGIMVQEQVIDQERVQELRTLVDNAIERIEQDLATYRPNIKIGKDHFNFREIASRNLERFDLRVTDNETCHFVQKYIMDHPAVKNVLRHNLGDDSEVDFDLSVVYSKPGACAQGWHADGDHQKGGKDAGWSVDGWNCQLSNAYAFCMFIPLIDLNDEVGFTQFWPKSHYSRDLAGFGKVAELIQTTFDGKCAAGDAIWYDYRLMHRGMPNHSPDKIRPVLQVIFKKKWYVEKSNFTEESIIPL